LLGEPQLRTEAELVVPVKAAVRLVGAVGKFGVM